MARQHDDIKANIFDKKIDEFRLAIAKDIPIGEKNAKSSIEINSIYVPSGTGSAERNRKTKRIRTALLWWAGQGNTLPSEKCKQREDNKFYWESVKDFNKATKQDSAENMSLSRALAYNLVKENFANLMPPSELDMLAPYFDSAEKRLEQLKHVHHGKINASKFVPFCNQWKKEPVDDASYRAIFDAIENHKVLSANYGSMHAGLVPDEVVFSPQQILLQYEHTQVVGYLHNPKDGKNIYRHFDINRLSNISVKEHVSYKREHQPRKKFKLVALVHQWVKDKLAYVKLSDDQVITEWEELSPDDLALCKSIHQRENYKWAKVEATIELTEKFLGKHDEWDAWFFVNSIAVFGADFIPLEPSQVVTEYARRAKDAYHSYNNLNLGQLEDS